MTEPPVAVAILFALRREARTFCRRFPIHETVASAPCRTHVCRGLGAPVLIVETGVGRERMNKALDWLLGRPLLGAAPFAPKMIVSAGFSGALCEDLRVGDIIVATDVIAPDDTCHAAHGFEINAARRCDYRRGRLLTVDRLIADPAEKRALALRHDVLAVDMETAVIGRRCAEAGIPFACIRAISDDAHAVLSPELDYIIDNGRVSLWRLAGSVLRRPTLAAELWRLGRNTRLAAERLGTALHELLDAREA